jgi:CDGSH-type Zn-finger protein
MAAPVRASDTPFAVAVEAGKDYWWCACGRSRSQPFCDGSVYFCGCKGSGHKPLCHGTHKKPV